MKIGRVQLSSALDVDAPGDQDAAALVTERCPRLLTRPTCTRWSNGECRSSGTTSICRTCSSAAASFPIARTWRIHFHVPLFTGEYGTLGSTQRYVAGVLRDVLATQATTHLEIET